MDVQGRGCPTSSESPVPPAAPCAQRFWRLGRATMVSSKAWTARKAGTGTRVCIAEPIRTLALDKDALCLFTQGCSCCARSTESIMTSSVDRSLAIMSCQCWQTNAAVPNCSRESRSLKTRVKMASGRAPRGQRWHRGGRLRLNGLMPSCRQEQYGLTRYVHSLSELTSWPRSYWSNDRVNAFGNACQCSNNRSADAMSLAASRR